MGLRKVPCFGYAKRVFFHLIDEPNGYLSNWYPLAFELEGKTFDCVEQYVMWKKAQLFKDDETANAILETSNPVEMKAFGGKVKGYVDSLWASKRYSVVKDAVYAKFSQNPELREQLLRTHGLFAEAAPNDCIWGIGIGMDDPARFDCTLWRGTNYLGCALQEVYTALKTEE